MQQTFFNMEATGQCMSPDASLQRKARTQNEQNLNGSQRQQDTFSTPQRVEGQNNLRICPPIYFFTSPTPFPEYHLILLCPRYPGTVSSLFPSLWYHLPPLPKSNPPPSLLPNITPCQGITSCPLHI